jgi:hypothetical protein
MTPRFADILAQRLRRIRVECYGEEGISALSEAMGLPVQTWVNVEAGIEVSAIVLLRFIDLTGCDPLWLLMGVGDRYLSRGANISSPSCTRIRPSEKGSP